MRLIAYDTSRRLRCFIPIKAWTKCRKTLGMKTWSKCSIRAIGSHQVGSGYVPIKACVKLQIETLIMKMVNMRFTMLRAFFMKMNKPRDKLLKEERKRERR